MKNTGENEKHLFVEFREHSDISILHPDKPLTPDIIQRWEKASMATAGAILVGAAETAERREKRDRSKAVAGSCK